MIHFDSDGVLANWHSQLAKHISLDIFNKMSRVDQETILKSVYETDPNFFNKLETNIQFDVVLDWLEQKGVEWGILTATGTTHHDLELVKEDKLKWFKRNYNIDPEQIVVVNDSADKKQYASSGAILIDDYGVNCKEWVANGGVAIKVEANIWCPHELISELDKLHTKGLLG